MSPGVLAVSPASAIKRPRQAHIFEREAHDHYVEPLRCSERLFELLDLPPETSVWDPACGFGRIVRAAAARGLDTLGTDIKPRWIGNPDGPHDPAARFHLHDFFSAGYPGRHTDVIASNPPYGRAEEFTEQALLRSRRMVALLLPESWLYGTKRARWRRTTPLHLVMPINPRPSMPPGYVIAAGRKPRGGTKNFAWYVWLHGYRGDPIVRDCMLDERMAVPA